MSDRAAAAVAAAAVITTSFASGGYSPSAWGWSTVGLALAAAAGLVATAEGVELGRLELTALGALIGLVAWVALSAVWSESLPRTMLEVQRGLVYVSALAVFLLLARAGSSGALLDGTLVGAAAVSLSGLVPAIVSDGTSTQLSRPIGYWNAMGLMAAMATVLALGRVCAPARLPIRVGAAAVLPPLVATLYLTFSRGGWLALALGLVVLVALHDRRADVAAAGAMLAAASAIAILGTEVGGRDLALLLIGLGAVAGAAAAVLLDRLGPVDFSMRRPRAVGGAFAVVVAVGAVALVVRAGGPAGVFGGAYDAFRSPTTQGGGELRSRLFSASGNARADYWRVAWHDVTAHPLLGAGAGAYELRWYRERPNTFGARDAHNLYLETLAELGPLGLLLLLAALGSPFVALLGPRDWTAPVAAGAYSVYLGHAFLDWDWEIPAVTIAALACGAALLVRSRGTRVVRLRGAARAAALAGVAAVALAALVGFAGARALESSNSAFDRGDYTRAAKEARRAHRFAPWASEPWRALGEAQLAGGSRASAAASFRRAIARDRQDWVPWYELALASRGAERSQAAAEGLARNPRSPPLIALSAPP